MEMLADPQAWIAFATLTALELVLGIDNIIFISILVDRLPEAQRDRARRLGLFGAMFMRIGLLLVLAWIIGLTAPLFSLLGEEISGRDLILIGGGLFLLWKSVGEIHQLMEGVEEAQAAGAGASFGAIVGQILVIDLVFSLDSIITAVGMVKQIEIMVAAVVASVALMMLFAARHRPLRLGASDHQDAGARLPRGGRRGADRRRLRPRRAQGLRLLRHGVLGRRRTAQHPHAQARRAAGAPARALRQDGRVNRRPVSGRAAQLR